MLDPRDELISELRKELAAARAEIVALKKEVAELKEALRKSSSNSSKPPSSDGPKARAERKKRKKKESAGKKPGAQPGHERSTRPLVPIENVSKARGNFGAVQNRLEHRLNNLATYQENLTASESRIRDVDMAAEMTKFTKLGILQQAGTSMLAQANQSSQNVLKLLG